MVSSDLRQAIQAIRQLMKSVSLVQEWQFVEDRINSESPELEIILKFPVSFKVSVKENEVPTEKNSSRASIFATKASYVSK